LVTSDVLVFQEAQSLAVVNPLELGIARQILAQKQFLQPLEIDTRCLRPGPDSQALVEGVAREHSDKSVTIKLIFGLVFSRALQRTIQGEALVIQICQNFIIAVKILEADKHMELRQFRHERVPGVHDVNNVGRAALLLLGGAQGRHASSTVAPDARPGVMTLFFSRDLALEDDVPGAS